jgi:hypothetical protein
MINYVDLFSGRSICPEQPPLPSGETCIEYETVRDDNFCLIGFKCVILRNNGADADQRENNVRRQVPAAAGEYYQSVYFSYTL